jgi:transcriptional regulator with XRE-family HTH domain
MQKRITSTDEEVAKRLRIARKRAGVSQVALGEAVGVSFQQIQKYERAADRISAGRLQQIARTLSVSVSFLLGDEATGAEPNELEAFANVEGAVELLSAFAAIADRKARRALITLAQAAAGHS